MSMLIILLVALLVVDGASRGRAHVYGAYALAGAAGGAGRSVAASSASWRARRAQRARESRSGRARLAVYALVRGAGRALIWAGIGASAGVRRAHAAYPKRRELAKQRRAALAQRLHTKTATPVEPSATPPEPEATPVQRPAMPPVAPATPVQRPAMPKATTKGMTMEITGAVEYVKAMDALADPSKWEGRIAELEEMRDAAVAAAESEYGTAGAADVGPAFDAAIAACVAAGETTSGVAAEAHDEHDAAIEALTGAESRAAQSYIGQA